MRTTHTCLIILCLVLSASALPLTGCAGGQTPASRTEAQSIKAGSQPNARNPQAGSPTEAQDSQTGSQPEAGAQTGQELKSKAASPAIDPEAFAGTWHRTDVSSSTSATITMTPDASTGTLTMDVDACYYTHSGVYTGIVELEDAHTGRLLLEDDSQIFTPQTVTFTLKGNRMEVISDGDGNLGFGMNVTIVGAYTRGEPYYINEDILNKTFSKDQQEAIQALLGDRYEECFQVPLEMGILEPRPLTPAEQHQYSLSGTLYQVMIPTYNIYRFNLLTGDNGHLYFNSSSAGYLTTDPDRQDSIVPPVSLGDQDIQPASKNSAYEKALKNPFCQAIFNYEEHVMERTDVRVYDSLLDTDKELYTREYLRTLPREILRAARNEIYARHGRIFRDEDLTTYFNTKLWYHPTVPQESFDDSVLSGLERQNLTLIRETEEELGF